ncbi:MAG: hypothetical protein CML46_09825 [Rhodobacteraceae bacterium]|nr:hypothetical protein [Paracoccaceae bacterium]MBR27224.1 hypothetical protein [Paracoccaceae bacterium]
MAPTPIRPASPVQRRPDSSPSALGMAAGSTGVSSPPVRAARIMVSRAWSDRSAGTAPEEAAFCMVTSQSEELGWVRRSIPMPVAAVNSG